MSDREATPDINTQTLNNEQLQLTVVRSPHCHVLFDVTVQPAAVEAAYQKAIRNVSKEVSIPGFRKGRAPEAFIIEKYPSQIDQEWKDVVLNTAFNEALSLAQLQPLKTGKTKLLKFAECSKEKGARFAIEFEVSPVIPQINPSELLISKIEPAEVTPELEADFLSRVQRQCATYEPITDRAAQEGDFITLEIEALTPEPQRIAYDTHVEISDKLAPWIREKVIGLKAGESAEGEWKAPEGAPQDEADAKPIRFTVHGVFTGQIPAADDELAKKVGLQTLEELKKKLNERLQQDVQEVAQERREGELRSLLRDKYSFDLPRSMIEEEANARLADYLKAYEKEGKAPPAGAHLQAIRAEFERMCIDQLQFFFLLRRFIAEKQITLTEADIGQELQHQISLIPSGKCALDLQAPHGEVRDQIQRIALSKKAIQFILDHATLIEA